ncbi:MAG: fibronectin type III domain-containing protein [Lachnospiraceae bacterium]|nr:fibronectin type III domain-containing protein [Lachnospiraceae bacterium]
MFHGFRKWKRRLAGFLAAVLILGSMSLTSVSAQEPDDSSAGTQLETLLQQVDEQTTGLAQTEDGTQGSEEAAQEAAADAQGTEREAEADASEGAGEEAAADVSEGSGEAEAGASEGSGDDAVDAVIEDTEEMTASVVLASGDGSEESETEDSDGSGSTTYVFDATELTASADKEDIEAGTVINEYFTIVGTVQKRISSSTGNVTSVELAKASGGAIEFTVDGTADVTVVVSSNGSSNTSTIALVDENGDTVANNESVETVTGTSKVTLTYSDLEAGTYSVVTPYSEDYGRVVRVYSVTVDAYAAAATATDYLFDATELTASIDKEEIEAGTVVNDYFMIVGTVTKRLSSSTGNVTSVEVAKNSGGAIEFTVDGTADVTLEMSSTGSSNESVVALVDGNGDTVANSEGVETITGTSKVTMTYTDLAAGTYSVVSPESGFNRGARVYTIAVTEYSSGTTKVVTPWEDVADPEITAVAVSGSTVTVTVSMVISGTEGADKVTVTMYDADENIVDTASYADKGTSGSVSFTPESSGTYTFVAQASRSDEETVKTSEVVSAEFVLPLETPSIKSVTSQGGGSVIVKWDAVAEAEEYIVTAAADGEETVTVTVTDTEAILTGLTTGVVYTFSVAAVRGEETTSAGTLSAEVVDEAQREWAFSAYGSSTSKSKDGYSGSVADGSVTIYSTGNGGKVVPASTDGLAFYYTTIDPETENFTLTATITVDSWTYSNGQEGFGMMVTDTIGTNGSSSALWTNSYQLLASKIEYYYDAETGEATTDTSASKISMKLGVGVNVKTGATPEGIAAVKAGEATLPDGFTTSQDTLEVSCGPLGTGTYNIIGNCTNESALTGNQEGSLLTTFKMSIQRNNTGYILTYMDEDGNIIGQNTYYHDEDDDGNVLDALTYIEEDVIYVGFFAARNATITVTDVEMTTIAPEDDEARLDRDTEYVTPSYTIESASFSNTAEYTLVYYGNADGTLLITDESGEVVVNETVAASEKSRTEVTLTEGDNIFTVTFTPDPDYVPGKYQLLSSYEAVTWTHTVTYTAFDGTYLYVGPEGVSTAAGTREDPLDIYTAVKIVAPGQTIVLLEGTYNLTKTVTVERGIDGTEDNLIYMIADPEAESRPVFDFGGACAGMVLAGDYWYFYGFDVTNSANAQKGIQVSGSYNTLDSIMAYKNGNTGIQISRYKSTDLWEDWPSYNLILNCTSYLNADAGYEDADGFAAKLTVADGNVFDGCIAAYNADDGWDLFSKAETGAIGVVTIQNCVAYKNGYVLDEDGNEVDAGNGNGFKMGGESIAVTHTLINSVSFANKAKGIDSNSNPAIHAYSSTTYNNENYNVAFYTSSAANTAFVGDGVLSYRDDGGTAEQIKPLGTQTLADITKSTNYYYNYYDSSNQSMNSEGTVVTADWFVSLDTEAAISGGVTGTNDTGVTRNADGTINMNGYLELTDLVADSVGTRMSGTASAVFTISDTGSGDTGDTGDTGSGDTEDTGSGDTEDTGNTGSGSTDTTTDSDGNINLDSEYFDEVIEQIEETQALGGGAVTIDPEKGYNSLPNRVMQALVNNGDVDLVFEFIHEGESYSIVIPAGTAVDDDTEWYGPLWLYEHYGSYTLSNLRNGGDENGDPGDEGNGNGNVSGVDSAATGDVESTWLTFCLIVMAAAAFGVSALTFRRKRGQSGR